MELLDTVLQRRSELGRPVVVGVSGYCGAGKSTLARALVDALPDAVRMRGDDFLDPERSHRRSDDWDGVDRDRLRRTVLEPFRSGGDGEFRRFDWSTRALSSPEPLPRADVLVVDLIGLFHPEVLDALDVTIWCDVPLAAAVERGTARDRALGRSHDLLWRDVWEPNDRDFAARFDPRGAAEVIVPTAYGDRMLVVLRGNSGSGKSTLARALQEALPAPTAVIGQDHFRRIVYREKGDGDGGMLHADLLAVAVAHCLEAGQHVVLEGIFDADRYTPMFERVAALADDVRWYAFDVPFEETVRRHGTRPQRDEFTVEQMRGWYHGWQPLGFVRERRIDPSERIAGVVARVLEDR